MRIASTIRLFLMIAFFALMQGCTNKKKGEGTLHFTAVSSSQSGIAFNNKIEENDSVNVFLNEYMYNGSGVGVGDFNNDGLTDVFFGGSMVSSRLYLNKGDFRFEDITKSAGVQTAQWCTGISVVDINADGWLDIYVSSSHSADAGKRKNLLFINSGGSPVQASSSRMERAGDRHGGGAVHFTEMAEAYGLADSGCSTQAAFLDYDKDGDLDMYLLNHRLFSQDANSVVPIDFTGDSPAADRLYRNDGVAAGRHHPVFHDVSKEAGIKEDGYGLGVVVTDANGDNWPDIYVANDYLGSDRFWMNKGDGTFSNIASTSLKHQSYNSMGVDAADINNDGLTDLAVLDMVPEMAERKKMMFSAASQEKFDMALRMGYDPAFMRNMLQLNNGVRKKENGREPYFSEIGQFAGISESDWSWSVLMADFDNDGWKDIHITNGLAKDVTNNDYAAFRSEHTEAGYNFSGSGGKMETATIAVLREHLDGYGSVKVNNYFYRNNGNLTFNNATADAGLDEPSVSNGAAYADLDNDGDLDLLVNNMNQEAFVWRNELRSSSTGAAQNFLSIQLKGEKSNRFGLGAKLFLYNGGAVQVVEQAPVRGFSSSVDCRLHFGTGSNAVIDSLKIIWPNDRQQVITNIAANQLLIVKQGSANLPTTKEQQAIAATVLSEASAAMGLNFQHTENPFFDFGNRRPLPQKYSQLGPCIATGDIDGDGLTDLFVGGAANQSGKLFFQQPDGMFLEKNLVDGQKPEEDLGAYLFDADGDKDVDLLITGGSQEFGSTAHNQPRFYRNDGKGNFSADPGALPRNITDITREAAITDYDNDGDPDIFIGGRLSPFNYPKSPRSYLLQNNNGRFTDVTKKVCPSLEFAGLVTGAVFTDFSGDKKPDLVICGEWMPVRFFQNNSGSFSEVTEQAGFAASAGQWRSLQAADVDGDGDQDLIAGNLGLNTKFKVSAEKPLQVYAGDFDGNQTVDLITAYHIKKEGGGDDLFPALDRAQLADQIPSIKKKYLLSSDYAKANMDDLLSNLNTANMTTGVCQTTTSVWIENRGGGRFEQHALPAVAQFAPTNSIIADDLDNDGITDLLLGGNEYGTEYATGRYDASYGVFLKGTGGGAFTPLPPSMSGFLVDGDIRSLSTLTVKDKKLILVGVNNDKLKYFVLHNKADKQRQMSVTVKK
jgi:hypothetical protein